MTSPVVELLLWYTSCRTKWCVFQLTK